MDKKRQGEIALKFIKYQFCCTAPTLYWTKDSIVNHAELAGVPKMEAMRFVTLLYNDVIKELKKM